MPSLSFMIAAKNHLFGIFSQITANSFNKVAQPLWLLLSVIPKN